MLDTKVMMVLASKASLPWGRLHSSGLQKDQTDVPRHLDLQAPIFSKTCALKPLRPGWSYPEFMKPRYLLFGFSAHLPTGDYQD